MRFGVSSTSARPAYALLAMACAVALPSAAQTSGGCSSGPNAVSYSATSSFSQGIGAPDLLAAWFRASTSETESTTPGTCDSRATLAGKITAGVQLLGVSAAITPLSGNAAVNASFAKTCAPPTYACNTADYCKKINVASGLCAKLPSIRWAIGPAKIEVPAKVGGYLSGTLISNSNATRCNNIVCAGVPKSGQIAGTTLAVDANSSAVLTLEIKGKHWGTGRREVGVTAYGCAEAKGSAGTDGCFKPYVTGSWKEFKKITFTLPRLGTWSVDADNNVVDFKPFFSTLSWTRSMGDATCSPYWSQSTNCP